jgi:hypothetical protein
MSGLAEHAAEAYLAGWALTDAPWTERIETGLAAAVTVACEHADDPAVLEATLQLGQLEGVWATIYQRRARLQRKHERAVLAAWKTATKGLDPADVVRVFRREAYLTSEATATRDPTKRWWQELGAAAALGWLRKLYHGDGYDALVTALADAIRAGMAEGEANALALAAARAGRAGFPIDRAFKTAYTRLASDHTITQRAADTARRMIDATAGDVGRRLAKLAGDSAGEKDMADGVGDVMDDRQAPTQGADWAVWGAILAGAAAFYSWMSGGASSLPGGGPDTPPPPRDQGGPVLLGWITAGDDRVCYQCSDYEANGPYAPEAVPGYPHARCRCSVDLARDYGSSSFLLALLDSFAN